MRTVTLLGLAALAVAGGASCTDTAGDPTAAPVTTIPATAPATTAASTVPPPAATTPAPAATPSPTPPVTVEGPCPYADPATIADTIGQRIARTTVTRTSPYVGCAYYRGNGEKAVDIAVSVLVSPTAAQARALAVAGAAGNPVDGVGDGGAAAVTDTGAVLGVSKGRALVVVRINQRISLEAVEIAKLVVARL